MKNKKHLAVIVIIATLTAAAWADAIAKQTEAGKTAPAEVPAVPQVLASKPDTITMTAAELKAYENDVIDRAEKFYTVSISSLFSIATTLATLLGIFIVVLVAYLPYLKWRYEKNVEKQLAEQAIEFRAGTLKAHDAIENQGKKMQQQFDDLNKKLSVAHALQFSGMASLAIKRDDFIEAFVNSLFVVGCFICAGEFDRVSNWIDRSIVVARLVLGNLKPWDKTTHDITAEQVTDINTWLAKSGQYDKFSGQLAELNGVMNELEKQVVPDDFVPPQPTDPIIPPAADPSAADEPTETDPENTDPDN